MDEKKAALPSIKDVPEASWKKLGEKRIYFGHQSVGFNIMDGINDIMRENPQIKLHILETNNREDFKSSLFAHSRVGKNEDPKLKCNDFEELMEKGLGSTLDIAFFKFCYVDITAGTDIEAIFSEYKRTISTLKEKYPKVTFIHMTVPLTTVQTGMKVWIKKVIGKSVWGYEDNIKRNQFNEKLRREFGEKEPLFDLAAYESTFPDGRRARFKNDGKIYYSLVSDYTKDGGHLNTIGRKKIAEQFLIFLANLK